MSYNYIIPLAVIAIFLIAYLVYMKFFYPKFREKYDQLNNEFESEWAKDKDSILNEYFSNPNKFKLISDVTQGEKVIGMISAKLPDSLQSKALEAIKSAVTFTSKVDMSQYYLVATNKGLHYTGFDGEKCFLNDVFDYNSLVEKTMKKDTFSFYYKNQKYTFKKEPILNGYPRFNVHERSKTPTSNDRATNYFVREYLDYELTENSQFKQSGKVIPSFVGLSVSKEKLKDTKVREYLAEEFNKKLGISAI